MALDLNSDFLLFAQECAEFVMRQEVIDSKFKTAQLQLDNAFKNCDEIVSENQKQDEKFKKLKQMLQQLKKSAKHESASIEVQREMEQKIGKATSDLEALEVSMKKIKQKKAKTGSLFIYFMLGHVNVRLWKKGEAIAFKEQYQEFKNNSVYLYILFPLVQLAAIYAFPELMPRPDAGEYLYPSWFRIISLLHSLWMLYYYVSAALRENIMSINGSSIQSWWLYRV